VVGSDHRLEVVSAWDVLEEKVRRQVVDVVVLDPAADGTIRTEEILSLAALYPAQPVLLYLALTPPSLRAVVELAKQGLTQVVLHRFDDDVVRFRALISRQRGSEIADLVLAQLAGPMSALATPLARAIRTLFQHPHRFWNAQDLAVAAGMPRRTMYRELQMAGFASPRVLVQSARLLRAYSYLREPGHRVSDVAEKLGYPSTRALLRHARELIGAMPSELRESLSESEFAARMLVSIRGEPPLPRPQNLRRRVASRGRPDRSEGDDQQY